MFSFVKKPPCEIKDENTNKLFSYEIYLLKSNLFTKGLT